MMLKKEFSTLKEHNDRVWRGYEQDVDNLRDKLSKFYLKILLMWTSV